MRPARGSRTLRICPASWPRRRRAEGSLKYPHTLKSSLVDSLLTTITMRFAARYLNRAPRLLLAGAAGATLGAGVYCLGEFHVAGRVRGRRVAQAPDTDRALVVWASGCDNTSTLKVLRQYQRLPPAAWRNAPSKLRCVHQLTTDAERRAQLRESAQLLRSSMLPVLRLDTAPPVVIAESKAVRGEYSPFPAPSSQSSANRQSTRRR